MHRVWRADRRVRTGVVVRALSAALAAVALFSLIGCSKQPVAVVNGQRISRQEFYDRLEQAAGERVLADLIARRMLASAYDKAGLKLSDQEIADEIAKIKKQAPDEASWQEYLKQQGMDEAEFTEFITFNMKVRRLAEKDVKVTDADLQKFFTENKAQFARPATVILSEIVLADKAKADEVRKQLDDPKASFATLARQYSVSTFTRERGGRRPEEAAAQIMPQALRSVVSGLQVGQVSQPVKVDAQWYIVKVDEKKAAEGADFNKVKDKVREAYMYTKAKPLQDIIEGLRKDARVTITDERYQAMSKMFGPPQALPSFGEQKGGAPSAEGGKAAPAVPATGHEGHDHAAPAPAPAAPAKQ